MMSFHDFLLWLSSTRDPLILVAIAISLPSILLYIAEIRTIVRHKEFHNSFYALVVLRSIPNLLYTLDSYYCYRLTILFGHFLYPIYQAFPNWMLRMSYFLTFYTMLSDYLATILILLNRWTAIRMPLDHNRFWRKYLRHSIFLVLGVPLVYVQQFTVNAFNQIASNSTMSFFIAQDFNPIFNAVPVTPLLSLCFMFICMVINVLILIEYRKEKVRLTAQKSHAQRKRKQVENKLLAYALLTFIGHMVMAINQLLVFLAVNANDLTIIEAIFTQYPWTMDLGSVVMPSWLLFWASDSFRTKIIDDFVPPRSWKGIFKNLKVSPIPPANVKPQSSTLQVPTNTNDAITRRVFRSLFIIILLNVGGYYIQVFYGIFIVPNISSVVSIWFSRQILGVLLNFGAAANAPILYFTSQEYCKAFQQEFPWLSKCCRLKPIITPQVPNGIIGPSLAQQMQAINVHVSANKKTLM